MSVNPIEVYTYLLVEMNKLGNEEVMRSMLNKYMLDPKDPRFVVQLGVILLTEIRQELEKLVDWDDDPEKVAAAIHKKYQRWNAEEVRKADVLVKTSVEVEADRKKREEAKAEREAKIAKENKERAKARKQKKPSLPALDIPKATKVIGSVGGYTLESGI